MKKLFAVSLILLLIVTAPGAANAQFGFSVVYDPTNYANALLRYSQLIAQLNQLRATYMQVLNQYNLAVQMSRNIPNMASRYAASWAPWRDASTHDIYGNATPEFNVADSRAVPTVIGGDLRHTRTHQPTNPG